MKFITGRENSIFHDSTPFTLFQNIPRILLVQQRRHVEPLGPLGSPRVLLRRRRWRRGLLRLMLGCRGGRHRRHVLLVPRQRSRRVGRRRRHSRLMLLVMVLMGGSGRQGGRRRRGWGGSCSSEIGHSGELEGREVDLLLIQDQ